MLCNDYFLKYQTCNEQYLNKKLPFGKRKLYKQCMNNLDEYKACVVGINQDKMIVKKQLTEEDLYQKRQQFKDKQNQTPNLKDKVGSDKNGSDEEQELARYKETLAKMERQWKQAVEAVNENKLQKKIDELNNQLNEQNKLIINLKKENQTLRLKAHLVDDDQQPDIKGDKGIAGLSENNNITVVTMERIKELERTLKAKESDFQERIIGYKGKINDLELDKRTKEKNIETLNTKLNEAQEENSQLRRLAHADEATKLKIELKAAKERLNIIEKELQKSNDYAKLEINQLTERCQKLQDELDGSLNADRTLKERSGQLQVINAQLQKKLNEQEGDLIKFSKIRSEMMEEREQLLGEMRELKARDSKYQIDIRQLQDTNDQLDRKCQDMIKKLQFADPKIMKEQRDLINDLKGKVIVLERELKMVHEGSEKEISQLREELEGLRSQRHDEDFNKDMQQHVEKMTMQKLRQELTNARQELDQAGQQVAGLNQEIKAQQVYYEAELSKLNKDKRNVVGIENDAIIIAQLQSKVKILETKLRDSLLEKDDFVRKVTMLNEELKIQEEHFRKEIQEQVQHASDLANNSLLNDNKFVNLMTKLNEEQRKYYKEKSSFEQSAKITSEMARQKVKELETELSKQSHFFEQSTEKYELEIKMLKEFQQGIQKDFEGKDQQIQILMDQVDKFKREKKEAFSLLRQRDIDLQRANKRLTDIQKQINDLQYTNNKMTNLRELPRAPSASIENRNNQSVIISNQGSKKLNDISLPDIKQSRPASQLRGASASKMTRGVNQQNLQKLITVEQFFQKWNSSGTNDSIKSELLDQVIGDNSLKLECVKRKQEFLLVIHQSFESNNQQIYEKATIIASELVDSKWIQQTEMIALNASKKIIKTLAPKRPTEDNNYTMSRHISAINLLCKLDKWDIEWTNQMSEEISKVAGLDTIINYLEQSQHDNYKAQAAQIVGMIAEEGSINNILQEKDSINILVDCMLHKQVIVKRNSAEALAFLIKDEAIRNSITNDRVLHAALGEHQKSTDQVYTENLLLILMNLSLSKHFKPAIYESGLLDSLIYNMVNGHTSEEQIYAIRIAFNLCYNSEIKSRNYEKLHPYILQVIQQGKDDVSLQALILLKKMTESEKTKTDNDMKILPALINSLKSKDKRILDLGLKNIMILCENNPKTILSEFDLKGQGISQCIEFYVNSNDLQLSIYSSHILCLYCIEGFVSEINQKGRIEYLNTLLKNFTAEDEKIRIQAIKMMSLILQDQYIHDIVYQLSDFQFLISDINEMANYESLYPEEQDLLMYVLRIFGEFAKTAKMSEINTQNGIIPICIKILMDSQKFRKEVRIWALVIINRGCYHQVQEIADRIIKGCFQTDPPLFLTFLLSITDPEDLDFTVHCKHIWTTIENYSGSVKQSLIMQQLQSNYSLVEKLIVGTKRTINSKSDISQHMRNTINNTRQASAEIDRMVKEATKKLAQQV
ncbi:ubiquitin carboxyl-terminal hydrolase family protein [Stylonychia lemnae]|uniref:Ubiquitin carboxyl-terminal hydrolase family protein n=1 Tax=Stylonychia lemnae TaxID=5949 RepID=A0A078B8A6_STYLE|nr:ubiquitin carboxyl-terminal hydrolase family protein [Stylonychia lemnae]|eukprot:CDW90750.1 ubiquitin carboxyl-terminal hydrolase family protein [Stylonychia lemnae]